MAFNFGGSSSAGGSGSIFGTTSSAGEQKNPFATASSGTTSNIFGNPSSTGGFGSGNQQGSTTPASSAPASTSTTLPSLFGGTGGGASSPFGQTPATTSAGGGSTGAAPWSFGNANNTSGGGGASSIFSPAGQKTTTAAGGSGLFAPSNPTSSVFGKPQTTSSSTPSLLGSAPMASPGATQDVKNNNSIFGGSAGANSSTPSGSNLFQNFGSKPASQSAGGAITPQANKPSPLSFSTTPAGNPPSASIFGQPKQSENQPPASSASEQPKSLFGEVKRDEQPKSSGFSFLNTPQAAQSSSQQPASQTGTSGASDNSQAPPAGSLFSNMNAGSAPASGSSGSSLFPGLSGQKAMPGSSSAAPANTTTSAASLFQTPGQQSSSGPTQPTTTNLFQKPNQPSSSGTSQPTTTSAAAPSGGLSNLFAGQTANASSSASQPNTTTATSAPSSGFSLFGGAGGAQAGTGNAPSTAAQSSNAAAASAASTATPVPAGSTATSAPSAFNTAGGPTASTAGSAPPNQSRLAQKSMEEIMTMWSTSLTTQQKTFQSLASQISHWDRMLVENSTKISSLYCRCFQDERDCSEVERQLSLLEHGQAELEAQLDRYESDVDKMIEQSGAGYEGVGGVDGERERTYKTAELCSARTVEMSHSLTDMIEEINAASSKLSSNSGRGATATDDPLSQIVRVLNSHLSQLQTIDSGASELKDKIDAAQKDLLVLNQNQSVNGSAWLQDFGRSYLGRR